MKMKMMMLIMIVCSLLSLTASTEPSDPDWSEWSVWSPCSRTCDGGATYQTRQCLDPKRGCQGPSIRYKICNMQPCPELVDFRLQQCRAHNNIPYQGKLYDWIGHVETSAPCALYCRDSQSDLVVQLSPRVHDGTRCKEGSLDMCIDGQCQAVGCDLQLGSDLKIDLCGICGGDGSSCSDSIYQWQYGGGVETRFSSPCSASCDEGEREMHPVCRNAITGVEMADTWCNDVPRPPAKITKCNQQPCPPRWSSGAWSPCSTSCGGGVKYRAVRCLQGRNATQVDESACLESDGPRPRSEEPCNIHECPQWFEGSWSQCSVTCGTGLMTRTVVCRDALGHVTDACDSRDQPESTRVCSVQPECPPVTPTTAAPNRPPREKVTPFNLFDDDEVEEEEEEAEVPSSSRSIPTRPTVPQPSALLSESLVIDETQLIPTDPTFIADQWGPCSVTCGDGIRQRQVHCKIFLEFSKTIAKLPDKECPGRKPVEREPCFMRPCSLSNRDQSNHRRAESGSRSHAVEDLQAATKLGLTGGHVTQKGGPLTYSWKLSGYSQCSASCLGGVQESIIECVREQDNQVVNPHLCPIEKRPDSITRTCNDIPCPPRWNISDFSTCTKSCGGGIQTREVHCIHEVARGGSNTLPVKADLCPQPPPREQQYCNMIDCPIDWHTGPWSKCSSTCGGGHKVRKVTCQQTLALGLVLTKTSNQCLGPKPTESKPCNLKPCEELSKPKILWTNQTYIQAGSHKKVTLKIGGKATVFKGTQVKIRCPVKHFDKSKITWMKDHEMLEKGGRLELTKKGMLRIQDVIYSDSGLYSCIAGMSVANLTLTVRPTPSPNSITDPEDELISANNWNTHPEKPEDHDGDESDPKTTSKKGKQGNWTSSSSVSTSGKHGNHRGGQAKTADSWPSVADTSIEEDVELKEIKGNSLVHQPTTRPNLDLKQGKGRPLDTWSTHEEDQVFLGGPLYSDQDQDWHRHTPHITYVTRARTIRPPASTTLAQVELWNTATGTSPGVGVEYREGNGGGTTATWPELIDPVPSSMPTRNWWGSVEEITQAADQQVDVPNSGRNHRYNSYPSPTKATSSSSRPKPLPYFQLLLAGLQTANRNRMVEPEPPAKSHKSKESKGKDLRDRARKNKNKSAAAHLPKQSLKVQVAATSPYDPDRGSAVILGKGKIENLHFEWLLTPWSKCSQTCGGSGFQVRAAQCIVRLNNVTKSVEADLCEDAGLVAPSTLQKCGLDSCPHWVPGAWTPCQESRCFTWNTALQKRNLQCRMDNGTILDPILCNEKDKPSQKRECFNENCRGTWKVGDWSECAAVCGSEGHQWRLLHCVWAGTNAAAGLACHDLPRPPVMRPCRGPPCPARGECRDSSTYCRLASTLNQCYIPRYGQRCCATCRRGLRRLLRIHGRQLFPPPTSANWTLPSV